MDYHHLLRNKDRLEEVAKELTTVEVGEFFELLTITDNELRCAAFFCLKHRSTYYSDVYVFWDRLVEKLSSENSFHRSIGLMLLAENVRWDKNKAFDGIFSQFMSHCTDEKFITARQTIQSIANIVPYRKDLMAKISEYLKSLDLSKYKENQQSLLKKDIESILKLCK